jgi:hypothetical protein
MPRSAGGWRMLPTEFGPWQTMYWRFRRFVRLLLFRNEHTPLLRAVGVPLTADAGADMPTVYRADFTNASVLFLAREFPMRNNDMIFVSNAPLTDYAKFLSIILPFAQSSANFLAFNPPAP